ncbi:MAG: hypothetical protein EHM88_14185, partial [Candidatus Rokuibacteriota bacterium]
MGVRLDAHGDERRLERGLRDPVDGGRRDPVAAGGGEHVEPVGNHPQRGLLGVGVHRFLLGGSQHILPNRTGGGHADHRAEPRRRARQRPRRDASVSSRGFADVALDEAVRRARALAPALRERAGGAETARQMEKPTLDDLHRAGLFRFHQPKRWGGMELPFVAIFDVPFEIARGCASTAWNVANLGIHHWMLALYDERAQQEVWGQDPDALIASGIAYPQGRGRRVDGGFVVSGLWNFSSGVDPATWNMLAVTVRDGERVVDHRMCLVPRGDYEVVDDWHVVGMRSTGS